MLIDIGYYNYVNLEKIVGVKCRKEETKEDACFWEEINKSKSCVDVTAGNKRRSYILTSDGKTYVSSLKSETLFKRINKALGYNFSENEPVE